MLNLRRVTPSVVYYNEWITVKYTEYTIRTLKKYTVTIIVVFVVFVGLFHIQITSYRTPSYCTIITSDLLYQIPVKTK